MPKKRQENLKSFRYIRKNMRKVELCDTWMCLWECRDYRIELYSGSVVIVRVEDLPCFNGGLLASILNTSREPILEWDEFPPFFRLSSRWLAAKLYYNYY